MLWELLTGRVSGLGRLGADEGGSGEGGGGDVMDEGPGLDAAARCACLGGASKCVAGGGDGAMPGWVDGADGCNLPWGTTPYIVPGLAACLTPFAGALLRHDAPPGRGGRGPEGAAARHPARLPPGPRRPPGVLLGPVPGGPPLVPRHHAPLASHE